MVKEAIDAGYRMIDTAYSYQNEKSVGEGIRNAGIPREEIFLTTKIYMMGVDGYAFAQNAFPKALERLGVDYIDMYMIHMPFADYYGAWRAMEEFYKQGRIRVLGVCNFSSADLVDFQRNVEIMPQVNQIERHPFYQ
ncbi:aldo/keto reductase, partial [Acidaminococcus fermentans]|uniref:aldo/keto reductase n=1 Tax=Acidaminococcus fermentans TaxID=905 RepID=UPI002430A165